MDCEPSKSSKYRCRPWWLSMLKRCSECLCVYVWNVLGRNSTTSVCMPPGNTESLAVSTIPRTLYVRVWRSVRVNGLERTVSSRSIVCIDTGIMAGDAISAKNRPLPSVGRPLVMAVRFMAEIPAPCIIVSSLAGDTISAKNRPLPSVQRPWVMVVRLLTEIPAPQPTLKSPGRAIYI